MHRLSDLAPVTKYYNEYFRSYQMDAHQHGEDEIMYVIEGACKTPCRNIRTGVWEDIVLSAGSYIHIRGGVFHDLFVEHNSPCRIMNLEYEASDPADKEAAPWSVVADDGSFLHILRVIHDKLGEWENGYYTDREFAGKDLELSLELLKRKIVLQQNKPPVPNDFAGQYVAKAKEYIRKHYSEKLSVPDISAHVGIAPAYLQRLFRQISGMTIMEYINDLRFPRSKYLLTHSKLSLVDVAENAGFGSRQRLAQVFCEKECCSPGQYRASSHYR